MLYTEVFRPFMVKEADGWSTGDCSVELGLLKKYAAPFVTGGFSQSRSDSVPVLMSCTGVFLVWCIKDMYFQAFLLFFQLPEVLIHQVVGDIFFSLLCPFEIRIA